ncbi:MAG: helix-turn-helix domain-containing protein, partial [Clostridia bacterium]|nr:helix-turn-helix domain-containing protein [Clostridia bacterium]
ILLDDIAKYTSRSKSSFCHLFESKMNISPKQYILQKKLALASKLIDEGVPHTVAAMQVGYENYSNFYRLYRKKLYQ